MRFIKGLLRSLILCALLLGAFAAWRLVTGKPLGGGCADSNDCSELFHVQCMHDPTGNYCTRQCRVATDCPADWRCVNAHAPDGTALEDRVCTRIGSSVLSGDAGAEPGTRSRRH